LSDSCGRAITPEGAQNLIEVAGDGDLVIQEILQPEIIVAMSQGNQGK
jgi:hypothetical protein